MSTPRRESGSDSEPCPEEIKDVADELASLRDQQIDPLTEPQKGAVEYIERRLRKAVEESDAEGE
jgi:hypothetical protein